GGLVREREGEDLFRTRLALAGEPGDTAGGPGGRGRARRGGGGAGGGVVGGGGGGRGGEGGGGRRGRRGRRRWPRVDGRRPGRAAARLTLKERDRGPGRLARERGQRLLRGADEAEHLARLGLAHEEIPRGRQRLGREGARLRGRPQLGPIVHVERQRGGLAHGA